MGLRRQRLFSQDVGSTKHEHALQGLHQGPVLLLIGFPIVLNAKHHLYMIGCIVSPRRSIALVQSDEPKVADGKVTDCILCDIDVRMHQRS